MITNRLASPHPALWHRMSWLVNALLCSAVALFSYRYLASFGPLPPSIVGNAHFFPWLLIHAGAAATALLIAPLQFLKGLRSGRPTAHRWSGRLYAVGCMVGGVSGLVLAAGVTAGPVAGLGFGLLAVAWLSTTGLAWRAAVVRDFSAHRAWIVRSFALTFAAVTLRVYLAVSESQLLPIDADAAYVAISFLCWVPNLVVAEIMLRRGTPRASRPAS